MTASNVTETEALVEVAEVEVAKPPLVPHVVIVVPPASFSEGGGEEAGVVVPQFSTTTFPVVEDEVKGGNTEATSTEAVWGGVVENVGTTTEEIIEGEATTTEEETPLALQPDATAPIDNSAEIEAQRVYQEERMRTEMRKEIEQEFLRGCITFEASGYYCLNNESRSTNGEVKQKRSVSVLSEAGDGGDKEIFVFRDGERTLLTVNDYDDTFPTQDVTGAHFVWQGMKGGRWQIFTGEIG